MPGCPRPMPVALSLQKQEKKSSGAEKEGNAVRASHLRPCMSTRHTLPTHLAPCLRSIKLAWISLNVSSALTDIFLATTLCAVA